MLRKIRCIIPNPNNKLNKDFIFLSSYRKNIIPKQIRKIEVPKFINDDADRNIPIIKNLFLFSDFL